MADTLKCLNQLPDQLPAASQRVRRAGFKLDGEWTRSVMSVTLCSLIISRCGHCSARCLCDIGLFC